MSTSKFMRLNCTFILCLLSYASIFSQPSNDECVASILLSCGSNLTGESTVNSTDNGDAVGCNPGIGTWYKIQPITAQTYEIVISNATFNYEISVASGSSCTNFNNVYCRPGSGTQQKHYFFGDPSEEYYLFMGSFLNSFSSGTFDIQINCITAPTNVICNTASDISCGQILTNQSTVNSVDYGDPLGCDIGIGVWYSFSPLVSETIEIIVENATFSNEVALAEGIACDNFVGLQCKRGFSNADFKIVFYAEAGKDYYIYVGDFNNNGLQSGSFDIGINCLTPPPNFSCTVAKVLSCGDDLIGESSIGAVDNNDIIGSCSIGVGTWYTFSPAVDETIEIYISDLDFTSEIAIVEASACGAFNVLQCNRIFMNRTNKVVFSGVSGQQYYIVIGDETSSGTRTGTYNLSVDCLAPPSNDLCVNAKPILCGDSFLNESTVGSTDHDYISNCNNGVGIWYSFMTTNSDAYEIKVKNPSIDMIFTVYSSVDCESFIRLQCRNVSATSSPNFIFQAIAGITYYIYIGDRYNGTDTGTFDISLQCYDPASNATCMGAKPISCGDSFLGESTEGAVNTFFLSGCSIGLGTWYTFSSPNAQTTRLTINNPSSSMEYGILSSADCLNFTRIVCTLIGENGNEDYIFLAEPGVDYFIFIGNSNNLITEYFDFDIILECVDPAPNIDCNTATDLDCGVPLLNQSTVGGINSGPSLSSGGVGTWYEFTAQVTETMTIRIDNATESFYIAAATSPDCDDFSIKKSKISFNPSDSIVFAVDQGVDYYVFIGDGFSFRTTYFDFDILIRCNTALSNNICLEATQLSCGDNLLSESTVGSTDNGDDLSCSSGVGVWYQFNPNAFGTASMSVTPDPNYDSSVAVASSDDCVSFTNVLCSQIIGNGVTESFEFAFDAGSVYYIYVGDRVNNGTGFGTFDLSISCDFCQTGDYAGANSLTGVQAISMDFETNGLIESNQDITNNVSVDYDSRTAIVLQEEFQVIIGSVFHAFIDGCGGN